MKTKVRDIRPHVVLHRDPRNGIAWIEDGEAGIGHSCHPNISDSGSPLGMIQRGYWGKMDRLFRSHGFIYNVSHIVTSDELDEIAAAECCCPACSERRI